MVAGRLANYAVLVPEVAKQLPEGAMKELQRLYYDTANVTHAPSLAGLRAMVPETQLLFGSDYSYIPIAPQLEALRASTLSASELAKILYQNADRLMPDPVVAPSSGSVG